MDDSLFYRNLIEPVLKGTGYEVTACSSGREALEKIAAGARFDAVVSDLEMPDMDGCQLARALRADAATAHLPIIALSSDRSSESIERARVAGFTDYIAKFRPSRSHRRAEGIRRHCPWRGGMTSTSLVLARQENTGAGAQYVTVRIGPQLFGLPIEMVHEVLRTGPHHAGAALEP